MSVSSVRASASHVSRWSMSVARALRPSGVMARTCCRPSDSSWVRVMSSSLSSSANTRVSDCGRWCATTANAPAARTPSKKIAEHAELVEAQGFGRALGPSRSARRSVLWRIRTAIPSSSSSTSTVV